MLFEMFPVYHAPHPLPRTRSFQLALLCTALAVLGYSVFFTTLLLTRHDALLSNAEDLGIMDQALWSLLHGNGLHQTICNIIGDINCVGLGGANRFAIHFEPFLFLITPVYLLWTTPKTLLIIQILAVASGAFPAFLLARLRLRNDWASLVIALLYLLYPAQQLAVINDFHPVALVAAFMLYTLYFLYTRQITWMFVFALLSMSCKEEVPLLIGLLGLWMLVFQRRWRSGLALSGLAGCWLLVAMILMHRAGGPLLAARYTYLGGSPLHVMLHLLRHPIEDVRRYILEPAHRAYLFSLLAPVACLPLLAPWILVLALPTLAINMLSSNANMYSGLYQYNAEIVPILLFATIEALVLLHRIIPTVGAWISVRLIRLTSHSRPATQRKSSPPSWYVPAQNVLLLGMAFMILVCMLARNAAYPLMPFGQGFQWPQVSFHTQLARHLAALIPSTATVSAQSDLVPHISHRSGIYLFPYADTTTDYIFLHALVANPYPFTSEDTYANEVRKLLGSGNYNIVVAQDGYLLLERSHQSTRPIIVDKHPSPALSLPQSFCSFLSPAQQAPSYPLQASLSLAPSGAPLLDLLGYDWQGPRVATHTSPASIVTYWRVRATSLPALQIKLQAHSSQGTHYQLSQKSLGLSFCPSTTWKQGTIIMVRSPQFCFCLPRNLSGQLTISLAVRPSRSSASNPASAFQAPYLYFSGNTRGRDASQLSLFPVTYF